MDKYKGMTVNERLYVSGLMKQFDNAVSLHDVNTVIEILKDIELTEESIEPILATLNLSKS